MNQFQRKKLLKSNTFQILEEIDNDLMDFQDLNHQELLQLSWFQDLLFYQHQENEHQGYIFNDNLSQI